MIEPHLQVCGFLPAFVPSFVPSRADVPWFCSTCRWSRRKPHRWGGWMGLTRVDGTGLCQSALEKQGPPRVRPHGRLAVGWVAVVFEKLLWCMSYRCHLLDVSFRHSTWRFVLFLSTTLSSFGQIQVLGQHLHFAL